MLNALRTILDFGNKDINSQRRSLYVEQTLDRSIEKVYLFSKLTYIHENHEQNKRTTEWDREVW